MINEHLEELAALHALDILDEAGESELLEAAQSDAEVAVLLREFAETAALLAYEAPEIAPPSALKQEILRQLPTRSASPHVILFPQWIPYALAACLMALGIAQTMQIIGLRSQVSNLQSGLLAKNSEADQLRRSNAMKDLRLAMLQEAAGAQADAAYASSHIMVAWDPVQHRGVVSMHDLPPPPPGHDYQLWVLDPKAQSPINAGLITGSRPFAVKPISTSSPGFAVSLEPSGGMPAPTGPILFAVEPGQ